MTLNITQEIIEEAIVEFEEMKGFNSKNDKKTQLDWLVDLY